MIQSPSMAGEISAATGDDGIHADNGLTINDGTIIVNNPMKA